MQTVYAAHLPLPTSDGASGLDDAIVAVSAWVSRRFGVEVSPLGTGRGASSDGASLEWSCRFGTAGGLFGLAIDQVNSTDPGFRWRTLIDLGVEDGHLWLRTRVLLYSALDGVVARPRYAVGRPGVIRDVVDSMVVQIDGRRLGQWKVIDEAAVDDYVAHLLDAGRRLPVVAISTQDNGQPFVRPAHLADRLLGLAHVVLVAQRAAFLVTDAIGKSLSCYRGALRIYWPGLTPSDDPYHHRAYVGGTLAHLGPDGVVDDILDLVGRSAGLSIGEPELRRRLRLEERAADLAERTAERDAARARIESIEVLANGGVDAETWSAFSAEYEEAQFRLQQSEEELLDAAVELEALREERDRANAQARELAKALAFARSDGSDSDVDDEQDPPSTVLHAVQRAAETCPGLVFLPETFESAEESQYEDPQRVLADLRMLNGVVEEWRSGDLAAGPHEALKQRCSAYRDGVSTTALNAYPMDYAREYNGERVNLGPHIRRGTGPVATILRIYWYQDAKAQCFVVGHVGRKLRDSGNKN